MTSRDYDVILVTSHSQSSKSSHSETRIRISYPCGRVCYITEVPIHALGQWAYSIVTVLTTSAQTRERRLQTTRSRGHTGTAVLSHVPCIVRLSSTATALGMDTEGRGTAHRTFMRLRTLRPPSADHAPPVHCTASHSNEGNARAPVKTQQNI